MFCFHPRIAHYGRDLRFVESVMEEGETTTGVGEDKAISDGGEEVVDSAVES